jgi:hypothetical protein
MSKVPSPARRDEEMSSRKKSIRSVVQSEGVLGLPPLARSIRSSKREPRQRGDLIKSQINACRFALLRAKPRSVLTEALHDIEDIVLDTPRGGSTAAQKLDSGPEQHRLGCAELAFGGFGSDEDWVYVSGEEGAIEHPVDSHPLSMTDHEIVASGSGPGAQRLTALQTLGERLREALASSDERTVEVE